MTRDSQHRLVTPGRDGWSGGFGLDAAVENCEHHLVKPGRGFGLGRHRIVTTALLNRNNGMSMDHATWENQH